LAASNGKSHWQAPTGARGSKHDELVEVMEVDDAICEFEVAVEVDCAAPTGTAFCDVVLEVVVAGLLFVIRYMARPIIRIIAMTIATPAAAATPARDSSNFISIDLMVIVLICHNTMRRTVQNTWLKGNS
jgi:hypothetical protein